MNWTELYRCIFDMLMVIWFFRPLQNQAGSSPAKRVAGICCLLCLAPIYVISGSGSLTVAITRFIIRAFIYAIWVFMEKGRNLRESLYYGLLCWIAFTTQNNIFLTPQLSFLRRNQIAWSQNPMVNRGISSVIELLMEFGILTLICRTFPFDSRRPIDRSRFIPLFIVVFCQLYVKSTLKTISGAASIGFASELTIYPILLQILLTTALILLERYLSTLYRREQERIEEIAVRYRYESVQARAEADSNLRQLHHDMKNHLLGIRQLVGNNEKLETYIDSLLQSTSGYEMLADTGNSLLDGLLSEKMRIAARENIAFSASVDVHGMAFLNDMDLSTIFGNVLDNALEASMRVQDKNKRCIQVRCNRDSGLFWLRVTNYYEGVLQREGETIRSSKDDPGHGLGLSGVRRTAEKYGGIMKTETDEFRSFILTVLIPLPDQSVSA